VVMCFDTFFFSF